MDMILLKKSFISSMRFLSHPSTQREINAKVEEVQHTCTFGDFVSACERLMTQTKDQIIDLETHLEKYGYIRPKGNSIKLIQLVIMVVVVVCFFFWGGGGE